MIKFNHIIRINQGRIEEVEQTYKAYISSGLEPNIRIYEYIIFYLFNLKSAIVL